MTSILTSELRSRWIEIKRIISSRPLLAYVVGIPIENWDTYMHSFPSDAEVQRIYLAIQDDRRNKTLRIKNALRRIVGYRESVSFSRKCGVSDSTLRAIIEGKKDIAGYEVINKLELFLSVTLPDFEVSIENPLTVKIYTQDSLAEIALEITKVADELKSFSLELIRSSRKMQTELDWRGYRTGPTDSLKKYIDRLLEHKDKVDLIWKTYVEKNI